MAFFDLKFFMGGIIISASPLLGAKITLEEIPSLLFAKSPAPGTPVPSEPPSPLASPVVAAAPAAASAHWTEEDEAEQAQRVAEVSAEAAAPLRVSVELLLRRNASVADSKTAQGSITLTGSGQLEANLNAHTRGQLRHR